MRRRTTLTIAACLPLLVPGVRQQRRLPVGDPMKALALFDLEADPGEKDDLYLSRPELARELEGRLKDLLGG